MTIPPVRQTGEIMQDQTGVIKLYKYISMILNVFSLDYDVATDPIRWVQVAPV